MGAPHTPQTRRECRKLFVEEGLTPNAISRRMGGNPVVQTVLNWARSPDESGKTWYDHREAYLDEYFGDITPESLGKWIMRQIHALQSSGESHTKNADALSKYTKALREILDPVYQMSMTYQVLTRLSSYLAANHPKLARKELIAAIRSFKNDEYLRLMGREPD